MNQTAHDHASAGAPTWLTHRTFLILLVGLAIVVRAGFLWEASGTPMFEAPGVDERWHDQWANEILDSDWNYPDVFFRAPGYPYFLAALYSVSNRSIAFARTVQLAISVGSIVLLYLIALRLFRPWVARSAALFMSAYGTLIWYEQALLIPVLIIFLNLLMLYLLLRYQELNKPKLLAFAGLVAGLSLICRPNLGLFLIVVGVWLYLHHRGASFKYVATRLALFWGIALIPMLPVAYHNYAVSGDFIPIASQGGINFYLGNNSVATGLTMRMPEITLDENIPWDRFIPTTDSIAEAESGKTLSPSEVSAFWSGKFASYVSDDPIGFLAGLGRKTYYFFAGFENSDNFDLYFYRRINDVYASLVWNKGLHFPFGLIAPLALIGAIMLWPQRRKLSLLYLFVFAYAPTVIGVLVTARHRLPVIPILIMFAMYAAYELVTRIRTRPIRESAAWIGAAVALLLFLNTELGGLGYANPKQSHFNMSLAYSRSGDKVRAAEELDSALAYDTTSATLLNDRAILYLEQGDLFAARQLLERARLNSYRDAEIENNLATVYLRQGLYDLARPLLLGVAQWSPDMPQPVFNLARIWWEQGNADSALKYYDYTLRRDPKFVEALNNKAGIYESLGSIQQARMAWRRAIKFNPGYETAGRNLIRSFLSENLADSAQAVLDGAAEPWLQSVDWYYQSALVAIAKGDKRAAGAILQESLTRYPDHAQSLSLRRQLQQNP